MCYIVSMFSAYVIFTLFTMGNSQVMNGHCEDKQTLLFKQNNLRIQNRNTQQLDHIKLHVYITIRLSKHSQVKQTLTYNNQ